LLETAPIYKVVLFVCNATISLELSNIAVSTSLRVAPGLRTIYCLYIIHMYVHMYVYVHMYYTYVFTYLTK
jgi:hypothetical protein